MTFGIGFDSISPHVLPRNVGNIGGYINGIYQWDHAAWDMFPNSRHMRINVTGSKNRGNTLDVEKFDATPADAPPWYDSITWCPKNQLTVYVNQANALAVISAMGRRQYFLWLATLDGSAPTIIHGRKVDMVQAIPAKYVGFNADMSYIYNPALLALLGGK
jgi:hypothetical protein